MSLPPEVPLDDLGGLPDRDALKSVLTCGKSPLAVIDLSACELFTDSWADMRSGWFFAASLTQSSQVSTSSPRTSPVAPYMHKIAAQIAMYLFIFYIIPF